MPVSPDLLLCARCLEEVPELFPAPCAEDPSPPSQWPLGMYHCPDCGTMLLSGVPHPWLCRACAELAGGPPPQLLEPGA